MSTLLTCLCLRRRAPIGHGVIEWAELMPERLALPNLRQLTVELSNPLDKDITRSVNFLSSSMPSDRLMIATLSIHLHLPSCSRSRKNAARNQAADL